MRMNRLCVQSGLGACSLVTSPVANCSNNNNHNNNNGTCCRPRKHEQRLLHNMGVHSVILDLLQIPFETKEDVCMNELMRLAHEFLQNFCLGNAQNQALLHKHIDLFLTPGLLEAQTMCAIFQVAPVTLALAYFSRKCLMHCCGILSVGQPQPVQRGEREGGPALRALHRDPRQARAVPKVPTDHRPDGQPVHQVTYQTHLRNAQMQKQWMTLCPTY